MEWLRCAQLLDACVTDSYRWLLPTTSALPLQAACKAHLHVVCCAGCKGLLWRPSLASCCLSGCCFGSGCFGCCCCLQRCCLALHTQSNATAAGRLAPTALVGSAARAAEGCKRSTYLCLGCWRVFWLIIAAVVLQLVAVLAVDLHAGLWAPAQQQTCTMICAVGHSGTEERVSRPTRPLQAQECPQADSNCCPTSRRAASPRGC